MNSEQKKAVKQTILECRELLEKDVEQVLINYGVYVNKDWVSIRDLVNLSETQEETKKDIEFAIEKLQKGGFDKSKAVKEYIKEVSYTYLNRLAALRTMEVRGLIGEILIPRTEYGSRSFIGARFYEVAREYCKYQQDGGLTYLLNLMFEEISEEIKTLFNTEDEYSFISPSNDALLKVIGLLCNKIDEDSWKQDEVIGWIYQYFNDKEKSDVFDRLYNKKEKVRVEDIPAATQLFTPEWIVKWIVDNSLGTIWEEIKQGKREGKRVEDIKLLDPCCGSGHFLVKAYDLFYQMYLEEGKYPKEDIPYKILENNIYGVDIDLRAVQLTALILFIKTKTYLRKNGCDTNTKDKLVVNLVCADSILLNGTRLQELKERHKNNKTILKMIDIIYDEFEDVRLKGSLIQPEKRLFPLFEEYKNMVAEREYANAKKDKKKQVKGQIGLIDNEYASLEEYKSKRDFTKEENELMDSLYTIYNEAVKANDITRQLFANEAVKSVRLVDVFMKQYDIVVTNPPYMGKRSMNDKLKKYVNENYKISSYDLYSLFIDRNLEFLVNDGLLGMITQQSFMFITTYDKFRDKLLNYNIFKAVQLGAKAFDDISGEKVNTAMFVIKKDHAEKIGKYCRLINYDSSETKRENLLNDENWYECNQEEFYKIDGKPFVFWISNNLRNLFKGNKQLDQIVDIKQGLATGNNARFVRFFWEVNRNSIGDKWIVYCKGAGFRQFYGGIDSIVFWKDNGKEIKNFRDLKTKELKSRPQNEEFYFKEGITYSLIGSGGFSARYLPKGCIFDVGGSCIFLKDKSISINYMLGLLNTDFVNYILSLLNPTLNYQVGDLKRIPFVYAKDELKQKVEYYASKCTDIYKEFESFEENAMDFCIPELLFFKGKNISQSLRNCIQNRFYIELDYCFYKYSIELLIREIYNLSKEDIQLIEKELGMLPFDFTVLQKPKIEKNKTSIQLREYITEANYNYVNDGFDETVYKKILDEFISGENLYVLSKRYSVNPLNLVNYIGDLSPELNSNIKVLVEKLISYFVGLVVGRYSNEGIEEKDDGIIPVDATIYNDNLPYRVYECIDTFFGNENVDNVVDEIERILGGSLEQYLNKEFFSMHLKLFSKRPIYWHICSPKKTFNCFVYYHKLDGDTLYKVKNIYLNQMIDRYKDDLKYYNEQFIDARAKGDKNKENDTKKRCSDLEEKLDDLYALDKKITEILPYKPDLDQGVLYNIIPLEPILSSTVSTEKEREEYYKEVKR